MAGRRKFQGPLSITIWYIIYIYLYMGGGGEESTGCEKRRKENTNEDREIDESRRSPN